MLDAKGRVRLRVTLAEWPREVMACPRMEALELSPAIAGAAAGLPRHGDPADRMIVATALHHRCPLVTRDATITKAGVAETIWA
jgi:PIN domain nuclease of toxin-antitoxin system